MDEAMSKKRTKVKGEDSSKILKEHGEEQQHHPGARHLIYNR